MSSTLSNEIDPRSVAHASSSNTIIRLLQVPLQAVEPSCRSDDVGESFPDVLVGRPRLQRRRDLQLRFFQREIIFRSNEGLRLPLVALLDGDDGEPDDGHHQQRRHDPSGRVNLQLGFFRVSF